MSQERSTTGTTRLSRRGALRASAAAGAAGVVLAGSAAAPSRVAAAQEGAWRTEHLEVDFTPHDGVDITRAGGGPPQRGDWNYIDAEIYAADDVNGTQIGTYQCFGAWTAAADDTEAPNQRLTTIQFRLDDGTIMGLINEVGTEQHVGAVQGGTGSYTGALGTFEQVEPYAPTPATPGAEAATPMPGTPTPGQTVVRAIFDLILPNVGT
jgi:hypothetical protein